MKRSEINRIKEKSESGNLKIFKGRNNLVAASAISDGEQVNVIKKAAERNNTRRSE